MVGKPDIHSFFYISYVLNEIPYHMILNIPSIL